MARCSLELGTVQLASSRSPLQARVSSRAQVASCGDEGAQHLSAQLALLAQLAHTAPTPGTSGRPWITKGRDYCFVVRPRFPPRTSAAQASVLVDALTQALTTTALWPQLGMAISSRRSTSGPGASGHELAIYLEHSGGGAIAVQKPHKLRQGVPMQDIERPEGVGAARLDRVCLDLHFSVAARATRDPATDPCASEYQHLLIGALMCIIDRPATMARSGLVLVSHESSRYLACCFPSLWAPGYLEHMSTRSAMLPTITHALSQVAGRHARSASLHAKLSELARRSGALQHGDGVDAHQSTFEAQHAHQAALSLRLWHAMEAGSLDRVSAKRLKPAFVADLAPHHGEFGRDEHLLEAQDRDVLPRPTAAADPAEGDLASDEELLELDSTMDREWSSCHSDLLGRDAAQRRFADARSNDQLREQDARRLHEESFEDMLI